MIQVSGESFWKWAATPSANSVDKDGAEGKNSIASVEFCAM